MLPLQWADLPPGPRHGRLRSRARLAVLLAAGLVVLLLAGPFRRLDTLVLDDLAQLGSSGIAALACLDAARRTRGRTRRAWVAMALGTAGWCLGQAGWAVAELVAGIDTPFPSLADVGYLTFPIFSTAAILTVPTERARLRGLDVLDGVSTALALACLSWTTCLSAVVHSHLQSPMAVTTLLAYPAGDVVALTAAILAIARARANRWTLCLIALGMAGMASSDSAFAYLVATGNYGTGGPSGIGWICGFAVLAVAALRQPTGLAGAPVTLGTAHGGTLYFLPHGPLGLAAVATLAQGIHRTLDAPEVGLLLVAAAVALVRQYLTIRDNRQLTAELAAHQADLAYHASHDPLTGLANRTLFVQQVHAAVERHRRDSEPFAILFCDLNDFKGVNDGLGHATGDRLLTMVAGRLSRALRRGDSLARLGGDEFAVLLRRGDKQRRAPEVGPGCRPADPDAEVDAKAVAARLQDALVPAFAIDGARVRVGVSIGVAGLRRHDPVSTTDSLLSRADIAMYAAKRTPSRLPVLFHDGLRLPEAADWELRPPLEEAIRDGVVQPHYQPIVALETGLLHGFEALARWPRGRQLIAPDVFLPVAARAGLMPALTTHMVRKVCAQLVEWTTRPGLGHLRIAVNVSPAQITDESFADRVIAITREFDVPVGALVVEITEEALLTDLPTAVRVADRLRNSGILLSLDDFGTGYSSLLHLHRLPLDSLKLDRAFVRGVDREPGLRRLLAGVVSLSGDLGLSVVAEGIERESQAQALVDLGCELGQGLLFAPAGDPRSCEPTLLRTSSASLLPLQSVRSTYAGARPA